MASKISVGSMGETPQTAGLRLDRKISPEITINRTLSRIITLATIDPVLLPLSPVAPVAPLLDPSETLTSKKVMDGNPPIAKDLLVHHSTVTEQDPPHSVRISRTSPVVDLFLDLREEM